MQLRVAAEGFTASAVGAGGVTTGAAMNTLVVAGALPPADALIVPKVSSVTVGALYTDVAIPPEVAASGPIAPTPFVTLKFTKVPSGARPAVVCTTAVIVDAPPESIDAGLAVRSSDVTVTGFRKSVRTAGRVFVALITAEAVMFTVFSVLVNMDGDTLARTVA